MSLVSRDAGPAEILRASQKDNLYVNNLQQNVLDIFRRFIGSRITILYSPYIKIFTKSWYYGYLALCNLQTLGEEYTGIMQVNETFITLPSKRLQLLNIFLQSGGELIYKNILLNLQKTIKKNEELNFNVKHIALQLIYALISLQPFLQQFHRSLFFLTGGYFHISKNITSIHYILVRHWMKNDSFRQGFSLLGIITMIHSMINCVKIIYETIQLHPNEGHGKEDSFPQTDNYYNACVCTLCLFAIRNTSALPCGHLFCWDCITASLNIKPECPICRDPSSKLKVIHLQNI